MALRSSRKKTVGRGLGQVEVSPFAPLETHIAWNRAKGIFWLFETIRSGISPRPGDPRAWYDRAIRSVGGLIILFMLLCGVIILVVDHLHKG